MLLAGRTHDVGVITTVVAEVLLASPGTNLFEIEQAFRDSSTAAALARQRGRPWSACRQRGQADKVAAGNAAVKVGVANGALSCASRSGTPTQVASLICTMVGDDDVAKYRRHAEECREQAAKAVNPLDKQAWLELAEGWIKLAQAEEQKRD
ncbi:hypothetical protein ACFIOY_13480 [Bradyrhizobium sp. TZ2]